jgi:septal ring factor EnvC (AmiA/AmiB activator)
MNENTSANKTSRLVLVLAILVALAGITTVGNSYRHSHRLQVRLDDATKELQQARNELQRTGSELEHVTSALEKTKRELDLILPRVDDSPKLAMARLKYASLRGLLDSTDLPPVREQARKIVELEREENFGR